MTPEREAFWLAVGGAVRAERIGADVTQESLAEAVGLSRTSIVNIEAGRQSCSVDRLLDIAFALDVSLSNLIPEMRQGETVAEVRSTVRGLQRKLDRIRQIVGTEP